LLLICACGGDNGPGSGTGDTDPVPQVINVTPASASQQLGTTLHLVAMATFADGSTGDISTKATWSSSKTLVATVSAAGLVNFAAIGPATITATLNGVSGSATLMVTPGPVVESVLYSFGATELDGVKPQSSPVQGSDGNFYGTTFTGGDTARLESTTGVCALPLYVCGTVYKITPAGGETVLHSFGLADGDGASPAAPLIQAGNGNLYGTTTQGSGGGHTCPDPHFFSCGAVFEITPAGVETVLYTFGASPSDGFYPIGAPTLGSDGNLYGTTALGGANKICVEDDKSCGVVYRITPAGDETVLYSFGASALDAADPSGSLIQANAGNFYGTTFAGGTNGAGTVYMITPAGAETILYSFGASAADGITPSGPLIQASDGNFYGTTSGGGGAGSCPYTSGCGTVFKITPAGVETILHSFGVSAADGNMPVGSLIQASDGNFYGMTSAGGTTGAGTVYMVTPAGVETVLYTFGASAADGVTPTGSLIQARDGNLYGATSSGGAHMAGTLFKLVP